MFRNKINETLKPGCLCNGMKTPDHDYEFHLGGTAKPAFRKPWIAAVISGTCVAAHDSAATWTMNIRCDRTGALNLIWMDADRGQALKATAANKIWGEDYYIAEPNLNQK
jgi:hypothetical protein